MWYRFDTDVEVGSARVGGKALGLIRATRAGLPVPPGLVLDVETTGGWIDEITASPAWARVRAALDAGEDPDPALEALQPVLGGLAPDRTMAAELADAAASLPDDALLAVRSSAPDEDAGGASFAGGYETTLGVAREHLAEAVRRSVVSAFSARALDYRRRQGLDLDAPAIAVVIQTQVAADRAGIAFSQNPETNDLDEASVDANHGLGETVVSGEVEPDHWVVHAPTGRIVERAVGAKQVAATLDDGDVHRRGGDGAGPCLDDDEVRAVADLAARVAAHRDEPTDIEWAYAGGELYLLQARPITTGVPLPPTMATDPGGDRTLYWDIGLMEGLTTNTPMSPMTTDWFFGFMDVLMGPQLGLPDLELHADDDPASSLLFAAGGRMYLNYSQVLTLVDPARAAGLMEMVDHLVVGRLRAVDPARYRARPPMPELHWSSLLRRVPRMAWSLRGVLADTVRALVRPESFRRDHDRQVDQAVTTLAALIDPEEQIGLATAEERGHRAVGRVMAGVSFAALYGYFVALGVLHLVAGRRSDEDADLVRTATTGMTENVAADLGVRLYEIVRRLEPDELADPGALAARFESRDLDDEVLELWDEFRTRYGARGPGELELTNPRYGDDPRLAAEQMCSMVGSVSPRERQGERRDDADEAYRSLRERLARRPVRRALLGWAHRRVRHLGGTRDTPKYLMVLANFAVRRAALRVGARLVDAGRLDRAEEVFDLTLDEAAAADPHTGGDDSRDLRAVRAARRPLLDRVARVRSLPHLIDSRGRIIRPAADTGSDPRVLTGAAVSPGAATGPVKVLHHPREKPVEPGDVLVAYTTDPGWTPLFVNAAAVLLEVGGRLQHGGVVAREYGTPCVAGIADITTRLTDGQRVEVDGTSGRVRLLDLDA